MGKSVWLLFLLICLWSNGLLAQNQQKLEELKAKLETVSDTAKVNLLFEIHDQVWANHPEEGLQYAKDALLLSEALSYSTGIINSYIKIANYNAQKSNYGKALENYNKAILLAEESNNKLLLAKALINVGIVHYRKADYEKTIEYAVSSLEIAESTKALGEVSRGVNLLGNVYSLTGDYQKANEYYLKSVSIAKKLGDKKGESSALTNLGTMKRAMGEQEAAIDFYNQSLELSRSIDNKEQIGLNLHNIGKAYRTLEEFGNAEKNFREALGIFEELADERQICNTQKELALNFSMTSKSDSAEAYFNRSLALAKKINSKFNIRLILSMMAEHYAKEKQFEKAYNYLEQEGQWRDSTLNLEMNKKIAELQTQYETEKKEQEIALLKQEKELNSTRLKFQFTLALALLFIAFSLLLIWYRRKKKTFELQLRQLRKLKEEADKKLAEEAIVVEKPQVEKKEELQAPIPGEERKQIRSIAVTVGDRIMLIRTDSIVYFNAEDNYVFLHDEEGKKYIVDYTLNTIEQKLPENFARIHRSHIINKDKIGNIRKGFKGKFIFFMADKSQTKLTSSLGYAEVIKGLLQI